MDARRKKFPVKLLTDAAARLETSAEVAQGLSLTLGHSLSFSLPSLAISVSAQTPTLLMVFNQNHPKQITDDIKLRHMPEQLVIFDRLLLSGDVQTIKHILKSTLQAHKVAVHSRISKWSRFSLHLQ